MRIGILKCGHLPAELEATYGDYGALYARLLEGQGFTFQDWSVVDMDLPTSPDQAEGWLISGSRHGAYENLPWIAPLEAFIRDVHHARLPLVGICFGHQIIAQALGGTVEKFEGGWAVGGTEYEIEGRSYRLHAWHQDQVRVLPEGARVIGTTPFCAHAVLAYGDDILTMQPHPEFDDGFVGSLLTHRAAAVEPDRLAGARAGLGQPIDSRAMAERIGAFFTRSERDDQTT